MTSPPNIVWITLESTRADYTSLGEGPRDVTPHMRRIANRRRGQAFTNCFAHGIWTLPSSASILTGTYPSHHDAGMGSEAIPESLPTIPELLGERGYRTACLSPNSHLSSATGLDRGFDRFAWLGKNTLRETAGVRTLVKYALNVRRHGGGLTLDSRRHHRGYIMNDIAKRWIRSFTGSGEPFFLYLHHGGPHHPYTPPRRYLEQFANEMPLSTEAAIELAFEHHDHLHENIADGLPFTDDELETLETLYTAEVAYADELVGDLFDYVYDRVGEDTVFVVTSDHGELFGERGLLAHMLTVDDAVCHVPLVVYGVDVGEPTDLVQHADVMETVLSRVGAPTDTLQGTDLAVDRRTHCIVQRGADRARRNLEVFADHNPDFDASRFPDGTVTALRAREFKYVASEEASALYRIPDETDDVTADYPEIASAFRDEVDAFLEGPGAPREEASREGEFTDAMRDQLSDLGYLVD